MLKRILSIPHLFGKIMVVVCMAGGAVCCLWALRILSRTGQDSAPVLAAALTFFGGELALMFAKTALSSKTTDKKEDSND